MWAEENSKALRKVLERLDACAQAIRAAQIVLGSSLDAIEAAIASNPSDPREDSALAIRDAIFALTTRLEGELTRSETSSTKHLPLITGQEFVVTAPLGLYGIAPGEPIELVKGLPILALLEVHTRQNRCDRQSLAALVQSLREAKSAWTRQAKRIALLLRFVSNALALSAIVDPGGEREINSQEEAKSLSQSLRHTIAHREPTPLSLHIPMNPRIVALLNELDDSAA